MTETNILLKHNEGYCWHQCDDVNFKGYFFEDDKPEFIYRDEKAVEKLLTIGNYESFLSCLKKISGVFSIIIGHGSEIWAAVDVARSMPVYYAADLSCVSDSSEFIRERLNIPIQGVDSVRLLELYEAGCVIHENTVYSEIKQLDIGQSLRIADGKASIYTYFIHTAVVMAPDDEETAYKALLEAAEKAVSYTMTAAGERPIVLSLSGGYDSRFVACMLRYLGAKNVSCYTYGNLNSHEVIESQKVANALGFRWTCVEHTDERILNILDKENDGYFEMCREHDFSIYLQNFVAVKYLHETGWFKKNSVFMTGLCHDMPTGFYIEEESRVASKYSFDASGAAEYVFDHLFMRDKVSEPIKKKLTEEVLGKISALNLTIHDYQSFVSVVDALTTGYSHSRRFLPMNNVHTYFGYEWLLPCWDKRLLTFWYGLPFKLRIRQGFYEKWLMDFLFAKYGLADKKAMVSYGKGGLKLKLKRFVGSLAVRILYPLNIPLTRSVDFNNWAPLEVALYKRIKTKHAINYRRASLANLLTIYIIESRYTTDVLASIKELTESE